VLDMVTPLFQSVSRAIVSARWLGPHGPHGGFALYSGLSMAFWCRRAYSPPDSWRQDAIVAAVSSRPWGRAAWNLAVTGPGPVARRRGVPALGLDGWLESGRAT